MNRSNQSERQSARQKKRDLRSPEADTATTMVPGTSINSLFKPLSDSQLDRVHHAALGLLEKLGMADATPRVIEVALENGCRLTPENRLLFPRSLVEDMIAKAAKQFTVHARDSRFDFEAKNGLLNFCTGGAAVSMLDIESKTYRSSTLKDLYDLARLCDTLQNIQWFTRPVVATDLEDLYELDVNTVYACAAGTSKHIATSITTGENLYRIQPMLDVLTGGEGKFAERPFCTVHATTIVSPMTFAPDSLDVACAAVDIGMPIQSQTGPQAGATSPAALAGTVVQGCAESLASLSVINMLNPGHPVILGNWLFVSDLRSGAFSGGGPEQALLGAASGQMSAYYGIPGGVGAGMTDSKVPDNQAGFEKALTVALAALAGGGFVYESAGMLGSILGCSFESMIIDDEMLSYIRRIARGIEVTEETLSESVVVDSATGAGHFLGHQQTMELMESEFVYPVAADRIPPSDWESKGSTDIEQRSTAMAKEILRTHFPEHIDQSTDTWIRNNYPIKLKRE